MGLPSGLLVLAAVVLHTQLLQSTEFTATLAEPEGDCYISTISAIVYHADSELPVMCYAFEETPVSSPEEEQEKEPLVVIPYVAGMSEDIRRVCRKFNIRVVFKSGRTLRSMTGC